MIQLSTDSRLAGVDPNLGGPLDPGRIAQEADFDLGGAAAGRDQADLAARVDQFAVQREDVVAVALAGGLEAEHDVVPGPLGDGPQESIAAHRFAA